VRVDIADPMGMVGYLVMNHLHPPFNDVRARRAVLTAMSQEDYMRAYAGDDKLWKPMPSYFTPGAPLYNEEGGDILEGPRNFDAARRLLAESGYAGQPVAFMAVQDLPHFKVWGEVTIDLMKRLGINLDVAAMDLGTLFARRPQKAPPGQGGWHMHINVNTGTDFIDPSNKLLRSTGELAANGWSASSAVEAGIAAWYAATGFDEEKQIARRLDKAAFDHVPYAPFGMSVRHFACRRNVSGIMAGLPLPFPWDVSKTAT
jgi:peptide/nickel transport system substrate-binding protein